MLLEYYTAIVRSRLRISRNSVHAVHTDTHLHLFLIPFVFLLAAAVIALMAEDNLYLPVRTKQFSALVL